MQDSWVGQHAKSLPFELDWLPVEPPGCVATLTQCCTTRAAVLCRPSRPAQQQNSTCRPTARMHRGTAWTKRKTVPSPRAIKYLIGGLGHTSLRPTIFHIAQVPGGTLPLARQTSRQAALWSPLSRKMSHCNGVVQYVFLVCRLLFSFSLFLFVYVFWGGKGGGGEGEWVVTDICPGTARLSA